MRYRKSSLLDVHIMNKAPFSSNRKSLTAHFAGVVGRSKESQHFYQPNIYPIRALQRLFSLQPSPVSRKQCFGMYKAHGPGFQHHYQIW